jgi:Family of unknown function (DUF6807)
MIRIAVSLAGLLLIAPTLIADNLTFNVTVTGGKEDLKNAIAVVALPSEIGNLAQNPLADVTAADGKKLLAQVQPAHLPLGGKVSRPELTIVIPELKAAQKLDLKVKLDINGTAKETFGWEQVDGMELLWFNKRPVLRYFHKPFDAKLYEKGKETANPTTKPYHHLYAADGKTIVTNSNTGQYPHHRGIYFGFNNISYGDGKKADVWHCRMGEHTEHEKTLSYESGPLFGRHLLQIGWIGQDGKPFAAEQRELTVYNVAGGALIDFASQLTTPLAKVRLDGDPQHAGFHFRANSAMEKNTKETFFIRPDGKGKPGEEKNWTAKGKGGPVNLPWNAMSFVLDGKRYTVVYLDHPNNPKEARQSERSYGRIGTYFEYDLTPEKPLKVQYRLWFQEGEPTVEQCEALSRAFMNPPAFNVSIR